MALGDTSSPSRIGQGQHVSDDRNLFLKMFGGEVLAAFQERVLTLDKHRTQSVSAGKSFQFPKTWKASSQYLTAGQEMLGNTIETDEVTITIDGLLVSFTEIWDLDAKMAHFDVTGEFSSELGRELARAFDKNVMRAMILSARGAGTAGWNNAGNIQENAALVAAPTTDAQKKAWFDAVLAANEQLFAKDVGSDVPRYMVVPKAVFNGLRYAKDGGEFLVANRDFSAANYGIENAKEVLEIDGVYIMPQRTIPNTDERVDPNVYASYQAAYDTTTGIMWCPDAVGTVKLIDVNMETERDARRKTDFMVASMAVGTGALRNECAVEFRTGAPTAI